MSAAFPTRAALLAVLGTMLGSVLWILIAVAGNLERAIPAILIGGIAGAATRIEPHRGRSIQVVSLIATLIGLTVVQYLVVRHSITSERVDLDLSRSAPLLLSPRVMWSSTFGWLRVYPIDIGFWVASASLAFFLPVGSSRAGPLRPSPADR